MDYFSGVYLFTGLDYWTGILDWTTGLDYWTGLLDWTTGLTFDLWHTFTHEPVYLNSERASERERERDASQREKGTQSIY